VGPPMLSGAGSIIHRETTVPWHARWQAALWLAGLAAWALPVAADIAYPTIEATFSEYERAVMLGRAGDHAAALRILDRLLRAFPDDYPLNRDATVIASWKGDCAGALRRFERIRRAENLEPYVVGPVADCAVAQARAGETVAAVSVLQTLLRHASDPYPLKRDIALIRIWQGDCEAALQEYDDLRGRASFEAYFAMPISECLMAQRRPREALTLLRAAEPAPEDEKELERTITRAELMLRLDLGVDETAPYVLAELATNSSDQGVREWVGIVEGGAGVARNTQLYARGLFTRASEPEYDTGNQDRGALGVRYRFNERWRLEQEVSADAHHGGRGGGTTRVLWQPRDTWNVQIEHATWAEDVPLRARANEVDATRTDGGVSWRSIDYRWDARASTADYDFSDGNARRSGFATAGYGYRMLPDIEQHVYLEAYRSTNSLEDAVYFNPRRDGYVGVLHRTDFVFNSRFQRHVDRLFLSLGRYDQDGFDAQARWGVRYEQDYDFDQDSALTTGLGYYRNVYDGRAEYETRFDIRFRRRFP
jgi:hypothetical protein